MRNAKRARCSRTGIIAVMLAALLACMLAACSAPKTALADDTAAKAAIPSVEKTVSTGGAFAKEAQAKAGALVTYRLTATMPQDIADRQSLVYRIVDDPPDGITIDWANVAAHVESSDGARKADVDVATTPVGNGASMTFAELKTACPGLAFGDKLVVEYQGHLREDLAAGTYRNIAQLEYRIDGEWKSTVQVEASITVPAASSPGGSAGTYGKTGDYLARFWPIAALAGLVLVGAGIRLGALGKRSRKQKKSADPVQGAR